mgnify:CR=1 FL=1
MLGKFLPYKNLLRHYVRGEDDQYVFPKSNLDWNSEAILQNKEFENMLSSYLIYSTIQYSRLFDIKNNINDMISLINQDIED